MIIHVQRDLRVMMLSDKSPYVVTLLVALITWVATEYYQDARQAGFINIDLKQENDVWTMRVTNLSPVVTIKELDLGVRCKDKVCFQKSAQGQYAVDRLVEPHYVDFEKSYGPTRLEFLTMNIPPKASFEANFSTETGVSQVHPFIRNNGNTLVVAVDGCEATQSFECYFAANFLGSMFGFWILSSIVVFVLLLDRSVKSQSAATGSGGGSARPGAEQASNAQRNFKVSVTPDGGE